MLKIKCLNHESILKNAAKHFASLNKYERKLEPVQPRRVVVTGLGTVSPLGINVKDTWDSLLLGKSGVVSLKGEAKYKDLKTQYAARLHPTFDSKKWRTQVADCQFFSLSLAVCSEAMEDCGYKPQTENEKCRSGIILGTSTSDKEVMEDCFAKIMQKGYPYMNRLVMLKVLYNLAASNVAITYGLQGYSNCPVTACTSAAHAIGDAFRQIKYGYTDFMLAGGAEIAVTPFNLHAFQNLGALCTKFNDQPEKASRPFDKQRGGFVIGEGAGVLALEEYEQAKRRGAKIYCELSGYGATCDAKNLEKPEENGYGGYRAMKQALIEAGFTPDMVDHVNCHSTSTEVGDKAEVYALERLFGNSKFGNFEEFSKSDDLECLKNSNIDENLLKQVTITGNKGHFGHALGAAGGIESVITVKSLQENIAPKILNLEDPLDTKLNLVRENQKQEINCSLKNSFAFGGLNVSLVFNRIVS